ncbi:MAG: dienelactone hydrolase family protein, partial [Rhodoplanes sp.]
MGTHLSLTASDGFELGAYRADPAGQPRGGLVVLQEIFGVNRHIRSVCDRFAEHGYVAIAPAVFDRYSRNFESGYSPAEVEEARKFIPRIDWRAMLRDTQAAI